MSDPSNTEWWFYHLERTTLEQAAGPLLTKCLERGWRVLTVSSNAHRRAALDEALWTFSDGSFLPHGREEAEGLDASEQPVLLIDRPENLNAASVCLLLDGTQLDDDAPYERCMVMFDDGDRQARDIARQQYKTAKDGGKTVRYFQQTGRGGWKEMGK